MEACEILFKIIDFKVYAYIRKAKYNAIKIANNRVNQLHTRGKTHKFSQFCKPVVTSLFTSCQQVVFAVSNLEQVVNNL